MPISKETLEVFQNRWPELAASTVKNRAAFLLKIGVKRIGQSIDYAALQHVDDIMAVINETENPNTRSTRLFHVLEMIKLTDNATLLKKYLKFVPAIKKASIAAQQDTTLENDPKSERYIPLADLQNSIVSVDAIKRAYSAGVKSYQDYLIMCLYVLTPALRNDYHGLQIVSKAADLTNDTNYLVLNRRVCYVYLTQYKNSKANGPVKVQLSKYCQSVIRRLMAMYKQMKLEPTYLINHIAMGRLSPMTESALQKRIPIVSAKYFGQPLSINDYRHIWEMHIQASDEYKTISVSDKEKLHSNLLHSLNTAIRYNRV
jgi:hypothetical protein